MGIQIATNIGQITISNNVISDIVGITATECVGVVGMASQKRVKDGVAELLKRENYSKGIIIKNENNELHIDLHLVILFGLNVSDIAKSVQERINYSLTESFGISAKSINIIVEDLNVSETPNK